VRPSAWPPPPPPSPPPLPPWLPSHIFKPPPPPPESPAALCRDEVEDCQPAICVVFHEFGVRHCKATCGHCTELGLPGEDELGLEVYGDSDFEYGAS